MRITIGSKVRAFDFRSRNLLPEEDACYVEGFVTEIGEEFYTISPTLRVFDGKTQLPEKETFQYRKNGLPNTWGIISNRVESLD